MVATRRLTELITGALPSLQLPEGPHVIALSGGADSAALALLGVESGRQATALHIDHGLPGSPAMADAAGAVAAMLDLQLDVEAVQLQAGPSTEERAREARYGVFQRIDGPVLTGHTRDDSVETMLINLVRGTGPVGLTGIPRHRPPNIYRPILELTRSETREIATLAGLPFVDDPMNQDMTLTRNRMRLGVLPLIREINPQADGALARLAGILDRDVTYLEEMSARYYTGPDIPIGLVQTLPRVLADRLLRRALEEVGVGPTADRLDRMWSVASGQSDRQDLADGRVVTRRGALLVIE
ncbi:MAG: tRNA lysidine(34) synthetase TilS [Acidimicrobiia bacterium]